MVYINATVGHSASLSTAKPSRSSSQSFTNTTPLQTKNQQTIQSKWVHATATPAAPAPARKAATASKCNDTICLNQTENEGMPCQCPLHSHSTMIAA
ncbi:uncharacterized protein RCC_12197 [Ramularia collo-cygni]|uniref:Uncharacterized protein n=1 Tax=Ramularia collo-cygni TaxID=112498 RepID=A0A2D3UPA8_9PEZI|nr:uncharacterized protein RCC_12197 [Ramularia collo-cygni]CZT15668.1 uncharacterized protein RCC_12197 [Ramularia collo-cygni]